MVNAQPRINPGERDAQLAQSAKDAEYTDRISADA